MLGLLLMSVDAENSRRMSRFLVPKEIGEMGCSWRRKRNLLRGVKAGKIENVHE